MACIDSLKERKRSIQQQQSQPIAIVPDDWTMAVIHIKTYICMNTNDGVRFVSWDDNGIYI